MKYLLAVFLLLVYLPSYAADEGQPAPEFHAKLFDGETFSLHAQSKQIVIIHFWATWCEACQTEMPLLDVYYQKHHKEGLQIVAISMDNIKDAAKAREMMKRFHFKGAMAKDSSYKGYGRIWRLPLTFVVDRKGILRKDGWVMSHILTRADLDKTLTPLLKGD